MDKLLDKCNKTVDVAVIVHMLFRSEYKFQNSYWYSYNGEKWIPCDNAYSLRKRLSDVISPMFASRC